VPDLGDPPADWEVLDPERETPVGEAE